MSADNQSIYTDGSYSERTGDWHVGDSPYKARWIVQMLERHPDVRPRTVCEIGCGPGRILAELRKALPEDSRFTGYEISPQAHAMSSPYADANIRFVLGSAFDDSEFYDLALIIDVVEHVEDCFAFLRQTKLKARYKILHIPLDAHVSAILRGRNAWDDVGHLHLFTYETALKTLEHSGYKIIDSFMTEGAVTLPTGSAQTHLANLIRRPLYWLSPKLSTRLVGGNSLLVLAE